MGTTSSITLRSLGKIAQCVPDVGAKMWCFFVCHAPSLEHPAFEGCIVRTSIALPFTAFTTRFRRCFQRFFQKVLLFQKNYIGLISSLGGATIFAK